MARRPKNGPVHQLRVSCEFDGRTPSTTYSTVYFFYWRANGQQFYDSARRADEIFEVAPISMRLLVARSSLCNQRSKQAQVPREVSLAQFYSQTPSGHSTIARSSSKVAGQLPAMKPSLITLSQPLCLCTLLFQVLVCVCTNDGTSASSIDCFTTSRQCVFRNDELRLIQAYEVQP